MNQMPISLRKNNLKSGCGGFSLIELLVVAVVFGIVFIAITRVMLTTVKSDARLTEQSETATRSGIVTSVLQTDFSNPLRFLSGSPISMSGAFPVDFLPHPDYQLSPGTALRLKQTTAAPLTSALLLPSGEARAHFTVAPETGATFGWRTASGAPNAAFSVISVARPSGGRRAFTISSQNGVETSGTGAADKIEVRVEQLAAPVGCRVAFYAVSPFETVLLARSAGSCPALPLEMVAEITDTDGTLASDLSGSFIVRPDSRRTAPLPYVGAVQIATPIFINPENGDLVLFRAEAGTDKTFTVSGATFQPTQTAAVTVRLPARGTYQSGDYIFIVDYAGSRSVVAAVVAVAAATPDTLKLSVTPVYTPSGAAWGFFYSRPVDFIGAAFPAGAEIIHLAAPVSYRYLAADKLVVRREGGGLWQNVAPGISAFNVVLNSGALNVELLANTEGVETYNTEASRKTYLSIPIE